MSDSRSLLALLDGQDDADVAGDARVKIAGLAYDSRWVEPGDLFVAVPGFRHDGLDFVPDALARGAVAVAAEVKRPESLEITWIRVPSARRALALMSCAWHGHPSRRLEVFGVTGTNGKTTVTALLESLLGSRGPVGRWSTTAVRYGSVHHTTPRTTPESLDLQAALAAMVDAGCWAAALEVSSHALALERVAGTAFAGAAFTNLSPDHLDFHRDMDDYLDTKARLFRTLPEGAPAVINLSDTRGRELAATASGRVVGYGWPDALSHGATYVIEDFAPRERGAELGLRTPTGLLQLTTPMLGRANAENVAAAVAMALEAGIESDRVIESVASFAGEPGRLEPIEAGQPFSVLVDFAHTPGALEAALRAGRTRATDGRLIVVFGCGGDRDRSKRPLMGEVAARLADRVLVTSDNPRSETPEAIIEEIVAGIPAPDRSRTVVEVDRATAIGRAVGDAAPGDCVLIAGKGHETEQVLGDGPVPFDDREVAADAICRLRRGAQEGRP